MEKNKEYRNVQMNFRVTPNEEKFIREKMKLAGITGPSAFLRKMALDGYIVKLNMDDVAEVSRLLRICSNNLNQYAKHANETGAIYKADIDDLQRQLSEIWARQGEIIERLGAIK